MTSMLIVDDSKEVLNFLKQIFEDKGFQVTTTESGIEAIQIIDKDSPDFIYSDIQMPEMNGFELAELVHEKFGRKVTLMTATNIELFEPEDHVRKGVYKIIHKSEFAEEVAYILNKQLKVG